VTSLHTFQLRRAREFGGITYICASCKI